MPDKPAQLETADFSKLRERCQEYIDLVERRPWNERIDSFIIDAITDERSDMEHTIFEIAMESIFGEDVWRWIRTKIEPSK